MFTSLLARFRPPAPPPPLPPAPVAEDWTTEDVLREVLAPIAPDSYLLATVRYPFLPHRTTQLDCQWATFSVLQRAAFVLNYVADLYARTQPQSAWSRPTVVYRTTDHPLAVERDPKLASDARGYAVFFDTDSGIRVELHMGHVSYVGLASVMSGDLPRGRRARA